MKEKLDNLGSDAVQNDLARLETWVTASDSDAVYVGMCPECGKAPWQRAHQVFCQGPNMWETSELGKKVKMLTKEVNKLTKR